MSERAAMDVLSHMEAIIRDIPWIGGILAHMGTSDFQVKQEEVALVGFLLQDKGRELVTLFEEAWEVLPKKRPIAV